MSVSEEMRLQFIKKLKRELKRISYPQPFCTKRYPNTNCYAYAVGLRSPDYGQNRYFPGWSNQDTHFLRPEFIITGMIEDMENLGIKCHEVEEKKAKEKTVKGTQIIAIFYSSIERDFHVIRKDKGGGWSHKLGYELSPRKLKYNYEHIINETYELIAYFQLSFQ